ncbi:tripartite tricarboxylate transporter substrate binding protein [Chloroflexota bacterium]
MGLKVALAVLMIVSVIGLGITGCGGEKPKPVEAGPYPAEMITVVVPYSPGGSTDRWARGLSVAAIDHFGVAWHVVNKPGAGATLGWKYMLDQPADGYHMMIVTPGPIITVLKESSPPWDPYDIKVACFVDMMGLILFVEPDKPWSTWEGFVSYVKENPGKMSLGATGSGLISASYFLEQAGIRDKVTFPFYENMSDAVADFLGGHITGLSTSMATAGPLVPDDAVPIITMGTTPILGWEDIPVASDVGMPGFDFPRFVILHPDTPDEIVDFIEDAFASLCEDTAVVKLVNALGETILYVPRAEAQATYTGFVEKLEATAGMLGWR